MPVFSITSSASLPTDGLATSNGLREPDCKMLYSKLLKEWHHWGSDGAALANFLLFQVFFYKAE
jgi:hypothetical protein